MGRPYPLQLADKQRHAEELLAPFDVPSWLPAVASGERDYRNKAKMVVGGTVDAPTIGIVENGRLTDLGLARSTLDPVRLSQVFATPIVRIEAAGGTAYLSPG